MRERANTYRFSRREAYGQLMQSIRENPILVYVASFAYLAPSDPSGPILRGVIIGRCLTAIRKNYTRFMENQR